MISSRKVDDLVMPVKKMAMDLIDACKFAGIDILITSTYRDFAAQDALYAKGRIAPGAIVTNAIGGKSYHNYRVAFDVVPMQNGKPVWGTEGKDSELWRRVGEIGEQIGLEWAGNWRRFREFPHFQYTAGLSLADFRARHMAGESMNPLPTRRNDK